MAVQLKGSGRTFLCDLKHAIRYEWLLVCFIGFLSQGFSSANASMIACPSGPSSNEVLSKSLLSNDWLSPYEMCQENEFANAGWSSFDGVGAGGSSAVFSSSNFQNEPKDPSAPESCLPLDVIPASTSGSGAGSASSSNGGGPSNQIAAGSSKFELPILIVLSWLRIEKSNEIPSAPSFELYRPPRFFALLG